MGACILAVDPEFVRIFKLLGIAIGGVIAHHHHRPLGQHHAAQLGVAMHHPPDAGRAARHAQHFLDRIGDQRGIVLNLLVLVRVGGKKPHPFCQRRRGSLVAGDHQLLHDRQRFGVIERPLAIDLRVDQVGEDVVLRLLAALVHIGLQRVLIFHHLALGFQLPLAGHHAGQAVDKGIGPALDRARVGDVEA